MNVAIFLDPHLAPESGGGHVITLNMLDAFMRHAARSHHQFHIFHWAETFDMPNLPEDIPVHSLARFPKASGFVETEDPELTRFILDQDIDFIWNLSPLSCPTQSIPYSTIVWDLEFRVQPYFPELSAHGEWERRQAMYRKTLSRAALIVTGTATGKDEILRYFAPSPERIHLLPHPTPNDCLHAPASDATILKRMGLRPAYILYPAQFWAHKNHYGILSALRIMKERGDSVPQAVFVGSDQGNMAHIKEVVQEFDLAEDVIFTGFIEREELIALYENALALVYYTHFGPENLPPLEAFALGCPVIASDVPGASEQLGDAVCMVSPTDFNGLADAIATFLDDPDVRTTYTTRGHERATRYTCDDFAKNALGLLDEFETIRRCWSTQPTENA